MSDCVSSLTGLIRTPVEQLDSIMSGMGQTVTDDSRLLLLHATDNVCAATRALSEGDSVRFQGRSLRVRTAIAVGHKIAIADIAVGQKVRKYGVVIGSATADIREGDHVHTHNLESDYLPTYARGELEDVVDQAAAEKEQH